MIPRAIAAAALLLAAACQPSAPPLEETPLPPLGGGTIDSTALACTPMVHPTDGYGNIGAIVPGAGQRLFWADLASGQLMLHDSIGGFHVGGRSETGGTALGLMGAIGWSGDSIWASDLQAHRVQFYSGEGRFRGSVQLNDAARVWVPRPGGRFVGLATRTARDTTWALVAAGPQGNGADTIATFPAPAMATIRITLPDSQVQETTNPYASQTWVVKSDDGARWCAAIPAGADQLRLACVDDRGRGYLDTTVTMAPREVPRAVYDSLVAKYVSQYGLDLGAVLQAIPPTSPLPLVNAMRVDVRGDIWINRAHPAEATGIWIRLRRDGAIRDTLLLPARLAPRGLRNDTIWSADLGGPQRQPVVVRCVVNR